MPGASRNTPATLPPGPSPAATSAPVLNSQAIAGEWDIVRFRGHEPRRLLESKRAAYADFSAEDVRLRIECNYSGLAGTVADGVFLPRPGDRMQTAMGCGPEREARDAALFGFFDRKPTVEWLADGRLRLVAGQDELILERPAKRRLAYLPSPQQLLGEWRLVEITRYWPEGGFTGSGLSQVQGRLIFDGIHASFSPCPRYRIAYRYAPDGRIEKLGGPPIPTEPQECDALRGEEFGRDMPRPWDVMRVLHADPLVELVDRDTILLSTERFGVLLSKRAEP